MPDLFSGDFIINVQGATNNSLGQGGQGVCGVHVTWDHTAICDISISLTSPSGQTITLVGPIGQFCTNMGNTGTTWDVTFLPCGGSAVPDPGFTAQWHSNQPWGSNNNYSGSYYPFAGCLENFSGPVNGNWILNVTDGQANDVGNLLNFEVIFCDPSGINCVLCEADAGDLTQGDVIECEGSNNLALDLMPTYIPPATPPPASDYSYAYVIGGLGGVIQAITSNPDMSSYAPGNYTVCGLSYYNGHQNLLPMPNGSLTVTQLANQLASSSPPFCGDMTSNCVNVTILANPPDTDEYAEICAPDCYDFLGQFYCQTGDYAVPQTDANGCPYNAILHLTVNQPSFVTVTEVICPGECSNNPNFPGACFPGSYTVVLQNSAGCDSTITLNLSSITVLANIQTPDTITCSQNTVPLSGAGSTSGIYTWTASNGGQLIGPTNQINATAGAAGSYQFRVCRTLGGITCCDSTSVVVASDINLPSVPVVIGLNAICVDSIQTYSIAAGNNGDTFNWSVPGSATILSGQGTGSIVVQWDTLVSGNICVTASNNCGMSMPGCLLVNAFQAPDTPLVTGIQIVCLDSSAVYSVDSVPGALYYLWEVTNGLLLNNDSSRNVQVLWNSNSGSGSICATAVNNCGESQPHCISVDIPTPPPFPGLISGNSSPCSGVPISYAITPVGTATGYLWTIPPGASILSGQNSTNIQIDWGSINGGQVCVQALNDCGTSQPQCLNVQVSAQPAANAGPDTQVCSLLASFNAQFSVSGSTGIWTEVTNNGGVLYADEISPNSTVEVSAPGLYLFQWTETNGNCSDSDTIAITFHEIPTSGTIQPICDANNQNYTVEFPILSGTAPFTVAGGMVTNGVFTSNPIPNGQSYQFQISDANGCLSSLISGVFNCNCSTNAGQMQQSTLEVCEGGTASAIPAQNTVFDGDDIGAYFLHSGSGSVLGTIFSQNQTGVFSFQNGMAFETTYYISFVVGNNVNGAPDLQDPCLSVAPGQPVIFHENPPTNAGVDQAVCALVLTVNGSPGNGLENWSVVGTPPGGSLVITSPQNITTDVTATLPGTYLLQLSVTVNGCTTLDTVQLTFGAPPIANNIVAICDPTNTTYTLTFQITGAGAPFSVNGQTIPGNNFSSAPINEGDTYNFVITDANGCISSPITGNHTCNCSTNAGAVSLTPIMLCPTDSAQVQLTSNPTLDGDDVAGFVLHTGSGTTLGAIIAQSLTGKFGFSPGMFYGVTYYVSAIAGNNSNGFPDINDPCLSLSAGQPVTFLEAPVPNAGADLGVCGLTAFLDASFGLFPGTWTLVSGPGTASIANSTNPKSSVTVSALGTYVFRWTEANGACLVFDEVTANFFPSPVIGLVTETCNATNTAYVISFTVSGGAQPYTVNGIAGSFTGNTFTSVEIPNNGAYAVSLIDLNGCPAPVASGSFMCFCATIAGTMDPNPLVFCEDQAATAVWNNDATLDGDDGIMFILHNLSGPLAGTVYGVSNQPSFTLLPGMATGTTYYISAVAGNLNSGTVDLNDPCLNVSLGTPVQWKALPEAFLSGDATICNGSSTVLSFNGTGTFPLTVNYTDGALNSVVNITGPLSTTISVNPSQSTTYSITSITDGTLPACSNTFNESVTVTVNQPVNAGTDGLPVELCAGNAQTIQLGTLITGEDAGGTWAETSAFPSGAGAFNASSGAFNPSNQAPGLYIFRYTVTAALPCPNQTSMASVEIHPVPVADAGPDALINCQTNSVTLGGPTTSAGAGLAYEWTSGNTPVGNSIQHTTSQSGTYQLSVTNAFGCTDTDEVVVVLDDDIPVAERISTQNVRCFGETNGSITIDSISSDHPPVLISLNDEPFSLNQSFTDLAPGAYVISLQDAAGCEWTSDTLIIAEPPQLTADLGGEISVILGDSVRLDPQLEAPFESLASVQWSPLMDTLHRDTLLQEFLPLKSLYVSFSAIDTNGCSTTDRVKILVEKPEQVFIPNVIRPGSLTFNDVATVFGGRGVEEVLYFKIFDRWGEQMFEAKNFQPNDPTQGWSGQFRGESVPPGVYVYVASVKFIDGVEKIYKGDVTVVR